MDVTETVEKWKELFALGTISDTKSGPSESKSFHFGQL